MNVYRIEGPGAFRFAGSKETASKTRTALAEQLKVTRNKVSVEAATIPTSKDELLHALNEIAMRADKAHGP